MKNSAKITKRKIENGVVYERYNVSINGKSDEILWSSQYNSYEPWNGNFNEDEMNMVPGIINEYRESELIYV
jgi:hypothetical protein